MSKQISCKEKYVKLEGNIYGYLPADVRSLFGSFCDAFFISARLVHGLRTARKVWFKKGSYRQDRGCCVGST
eukprot:5713406-Lingulodinium_polyedra.AAC.1